PNGGIAKVFLGSATGVRGSGVVTLESGEYGALLGASVDGAGDVNGDGYDDVIVGAPGQGASGDGWAYVFPGSASGVSTPAIWTGIGGGNGGAAFGASVAGVGDVNADGYADVAVGAPNYTTGGSQRGRVRVFRGGPGGIAGTWYTKSGPTSVGECVAAGGDFDRNGRSNVLISAPTYSIGGLMLVYDSQAGFPDDDWHSGEYAETGFSLAAGDFDGDRVPDFTGGSRQDGSAPGTVAVYEGNPDWCKHGPYRSRQLTTADDPVAEGGISAEPAGVRLTALGWSAAGRTDLRLEHQVTPVGAAWGAVQSGAALDTGAPGSPALELAVDVPVTPFTAYRWRTRVAAHDPVFAYSPWMSEPVTVAMERQFRSAHDPVAAPVALEAAPTGLRLGAPRPNPVAGACAIPFALPRGGSARMEVFDVAGRRVATLLDGPVEAGARVTGWDARDHSGRAVANGVYFVRLRAGGESAATRVLVRR
ncbi:MAG TPA: FlgD immunoglobulin-like domain containing protein, partial [bacterium]|nr:FlgD immunoglobulin-like domain containing protein [bacterium]